ncbi:MAG: FAD-binding protein, partial [Thermodesulfovibrionales bacterium]|nr:FAD-binding protein [Thermodesulfovibrionales bacterium]
MMGKAGSKAGFLKDALGALGPSAGVRFGEPMASHTALGIGGPAEVFAVPESEDVLVRVMRAAMECGAPVVALGGGTNLLVRDGGVPGLVVHVGALKSLEATGGEGAEVRVRAGAGVRLQQLLAYCRREGLSGIEALAGIPGMLGGAVAGNAGSYGTEIKDVVQMIRLVGFDGTVRELGVEDAGFVYRGSSL